MDVSIQWTRRYASWGCKVHLYMEEDDVQRGKHSLPVWQPGPHECGEGSACRQARSQDFILTEAKWTRNNEWRAPKARSPTRLGGVGSVVSCGVCVAAGSDRSPGHQPILGHTKSIDACFGNILSYYSFTKID